MVVSWVVHNIDFVRFAKQICVADVAQVKAEHVPGDIVVRERRPCGNARKRIYLI